MVGSRKDKKKRRKNKKRGRGEVGLLPRPKKMWAVSRGKEFGHVGNVSKISDSYKVSVKNFKGDAGASSLVGGRGFVPSIPILTVAKLERPSTEDCGSALDLFPRESK